MAYLTRKKRKARTRWLLRFLLLGVFLWGMLRGGAALLGSWDVLCIQNVEVYGLTRRPVPDSVEAAKGENLLKVDAGEIRKTFLDFQDIRKVVVHKRYPDTLIIRLEERIPLALISRDNKIFCVDKEGAFFPSNGQEDLPVIKGKESLAEGLRLLERVSPSDPVPVASLNCTSPFEVVMTVQRETEGLLACNFGRGDMDEKWGVFMDLMKDGIQATYVDLRFIPYVVVRNGGGD